MNTARLVRLGVALEAVAGRATRLPSATRELCRGQTCRLARSALARWVLRAAEALTVPRLARHFVGRKRVLWRWCEAAAGTGIERVVILGPGCDGLGPQLAWQYPRLDVVELEHPRRSQARLDLLRSLPVTDNLRLVACDLAVPGALDAHLAGAQRTLVVAEGVLMYLRTKVVLGLLHAASRQPACVGVMASFATPRADGRLAFAQARPWAAWYLAAAGEPWRWALDPARVRAALRLRGFGVEAVAGVVSRKHAASRADASGMVCAGEVLLHARRVGASR